MYTEIISDLMLAGLYIIVGIIAMWDKDNRSFGLIVFIAGTVMFFMLLHQRHSVLHREPVISSCFLIQDSDGNHYLLVDSTLRCFGGYDTPFYSVIKPEQVISTDDTCSNCRAIMREHFDVSDHCTPEERKARIQQQIDYLTAPL